MRTRTIVLLLALVGASVCAAPVAAAKLAKGNSVVWVGLNGNRSHIVSLPVGINSLGEENEVVLHLGYSHFLSDAWACVVSGCLDVGSQKFEPAAGGEATFKSNSYNVRLGLDRYAFINDEVAIYAGPGILYWSGDSKYKSGGPEITWPRVKEVAFNGRLGLYARLGSRYGLFGHIGQVIGTNSAKDGAGNKVSWWSSHNEGSVGLALDF